MLYPTTPQTLHSSSSSLKDMDCVKNSKFVDEFSVDNLFDFSYGFVEDEIEQLDEHPNVFNSEKPYSVSHQKQLEIIEAKIEDFGSFPNNELSIPENGLDDLEWLSHFVEEESFVENTLTYPTGNLLEKQLENRSDTEKPVQDKSCFTSPVQTRARTKRTRTGGRIWSLGSVSLTGSSTSSSFSSTTTTTSLCLSQTAESTVRRQQRRHCEVQPRRCTHCGVQKTPQWRAGPMGTKTLCNACGVRFKSGRLLPEYRPACSPTFSNDLHSNNHRKVLEMRQKKEAETGLAQPVQSF
ncbi:GATA transcription factor 5-like isoform X2 [Lycium barbarum]|uniref:GATA transcription factor 5-like isoform X2 n=1 Tax=Lycium barbarum TaxID=112863 RepID=UPI00293F6890|nr:GATA transcription factor 5-like isoform X2 [Lycium barbarum]